MTTTPAPATEAQLDGLTCRMLLGHGSVGRILFTRGALPEARPVAFVLDDGLVAFSVGDPVVAAAIVANTVAAFEIDEHDPVSGSAWSVVAVGQIQEITAETRVARIRRHLAGPWAGGPAGRVLGLRPRWFTGSRHDPPTGPREQGATTPPAQHPADRAERRIEIGRALSALYGDEVDAEDRADLRTDEEPS